MTGKGNVATDAGKADAASPHTLPTLELLCHVHRADVVWFKEPGELELVQEREEEEEAGALRFPPQLQACTGPTSRPPGLACAAFHADSAVEDKDPHVTVMATCFYFLKLAVS